MLDCCWFGNNEDEAESRFVEARNEKFEDADKDWLTAMVISLLLDEVTSSEPYLEKRPLMVLKIFSVMSEKLILVAELRRPLEDEHFWSIVSTTYDDPDDRIDVVDDDDARQLDEEMLTAFTRATTWFVVDDDDDDDEIVVWLTVPHSEVEESKSRSAVNKTILLFDEVSTVVVEGEARKTEMRFAVGDDDDDEENFL